MSAVYTLAVGVWKLFTGDLVNYVVGHVLEKPQAFKAVLIYSNKL